jgi:hypothetical protein
LLLFFFPLGVSRRPSGRRRGIGPRQPVLPVSLRARHDTRYFSKELLDGFDGL